jgi:hypothetical protein
MEKFDYTMTQLVANASARYPDGQRSTLQCFNCGCEGGICFVVMKRKSVKKMQLEGRAIKCPIHQGTTSSVYAHKFYATIRQLQCEVQGIVWDWFDVPDDESSNHKMHIDASVFCGAVCTRFEIDGETHFHSRGTSRDDNDERKDCILRQSGVGLLRLHYMDVDYWPQYIQNALNVNYQTVKYTKSYMECLHPADHECVVSLR